MISLIIGIELVYDNTLVLPETSELLIENAISKAQAAAKQRNMLAIGDDSGIFIEALDFFPGVHSRRWAGNSDDDELRNQKILKYLKDTENRRAYLISEFALVDPTGTVLAKSNVKNTFNISKDARGTNGFAYDRILEIDIENNGLNHGKDYSQLMEAFKEIRDIGHLPTIAELSQSAKNSWNQRGYLLAKDISKQLMELNLV